MKKFLQLIGFIVLAELAGIVGSFSTISSIPTWYATLTRPALNPPSWIFGPVWTTLFALMGVAAFLVFRQGWQKREVKKALAVFVLQLILNTLWSIIFFGLHNIGLALFEIILLWLAILVTIISFYRVSKAAAYLLIPYIAWVSFAIYLNYAIWGLN